MMYVIKRSGDREEVRFDAILERISSLTTGLDAAFIDPAEITRRVVDGLHDEIKTAELDDLAARICASMATTHSDFLRLAARIAISNLHKDTTPSFVEVIQRLHAHVEPKTGRHVPFVSDELLDIVTKHGEEIEAQIDHNRDYDVFDFFGFKTLEGQKYLMRMHNRVVERPQHMFMRVALGIHGYDLKAAFETYHHMSRKDFIHATPTLFNAGTPCPQMSSCFLLAMSEDSIRGIYKTMTDAALVSQSGGGLSISMHNIRATGSFITKSRGTSNGLVPMLRVFNETARYVDQGGKRKGAFCIYLEPWHADVFDFIDLRKNHGAEERRSRDLFLALWVPDEFMRRVEADGEWMLMCPNECPGLFNVYGREFETLYKQYESEGRGVKTVKARDLWFHIVNAQIETGTPFMLYKDTANHKSNQKNLGTIRSSNLCTEIIEYSDDKETAICNLASICVNQFIRTDGTYDFERLHDVAKIVCRNLNKVIDRNLYVLPEMEYSNLRHRPIGIGIQGLADTFALMKLTFDEPRARELNKNIFETIYHGALEASVELAEKDGHYETFPGSPASEGKFQFDLWGMSPDSGLWDWEKTRTDMVRHGLRNSLFMAPMPTATTAQVFGNNESIEPFTSNLYVRRVISGEFILINKHLLRDLQEVGMWNEDLRRRLIAERGSVQNIHEIPEDIRMRYRTVWEISQRSIVDMAVDRGPFICQSMSMNIHMRGATAGKLTALHFHAWRRGLKTGMYYLRNTPAVEAVQFTVDNSKHPEQVQKHIPVQEKVPVSVQRADDDPNVCISCGS